MKEIHFKNYTDFCKFFEKNEDFFMIVLDYEDFVVYQYYSQYFFVNKSETDIDLVYELEEVARLSYDVKHDFQIKDAETLHSMFDCDVCGEQVTNNYINYLWFKEVKNHD